MLSDVAEVSGGAVCYHSITRFVLTDAGMKPSHVYNVTLTVLQPIPRHLYRSASYKEWLTVLGDVSRPKMPPATALPRG